MKNFKFDLNAKVAIYVPSTTDVNVPTDNKKEVYFGMERNGLISALEVGGDHFEAGLEYYRRETRPATEAEEKEAVKYLRARNYTHFKLSKQCTLKR